MLLARVFIAPMERRARLIGDASPNRGAREEVTADAITRYRFASEEASIRFRPAVAKRPRVTRSAAHNVRADATRTVAEPPGEPDRHARNQNRHATEETDEIPGRDRLKLADRGVQITHQELAERACATYFIENTGTPTCHASKLRRGARKVHREMGRRA